MDVDKKLQCISMMEYVGDWAEWRKNLRRAVSVGKRVGMSEEEIESLATQIGDFLAEKVCPATPEEELLKEMWRVATPEERRMIAGLMVKMSE
ncbi:MAG: DUF3243 domain-containing protein [Anaerolineae bacterium]